MILVSVHKTIIAMISGRCRCRKVESAAKFVMDINCDLTDLGLI
jgi:hypothetical protein